MYIDKEEGGNTYGFSLVKPIKKKENFFLVRKSTRGIASLGCFLWKWFKAHKSQKKHVTFILVDWDFISDLFEAWNIR
jgi:hypothetical protein